MEITYVNQKGFTFGPPDRQDVGVAGGEGRVVRANSIVLSSCIEVRAQYFCFSATLRR